MFNLWSGFTFRILVIVVIIAVACSNVLAFTSTSSSSINRNHIQTATKGMIKKMNQPKKVFPSPSYLFQSSTNNNDNASTTRNSDDESLDLSKKRRRRKDGKNNLAFVSSSSGSSSQDTKEQNISIQEIQKIQQPIQMKIVDVRDAVVSKSQSSTEDVLSQGKVVTDKEETDGRLILEEKQEKVSYNMDDDDEDDEEYEYYYEDENGNEIVINDLSTLPMSSRKTLSSSPPSTTTLPKTIPTTTSSMTNNMNRNILNNNNSSSNSSLEAILADAKRLRQEQKQAVASGTIEDPEGLSIPRLLKGAISNIVTIDFFLVCAELLWFLSGIFCSYVLKDDTVQIAFNMQFERVVQPALGILMVGAAAGAVFKDPKMDEEE